MEKTYNCIHKAAQTGPSLILPIFFGPIGHIIIVILRYTLLIQPCLFYSTKFGLVYFLVLGNNRLGKGKMRVH